MFPYLGVQVSMLSVNNRAHLYITSLVLKAVYNIKVKHKEDKSE